MIDQNSIQIDTSNFEKIKQNSEKNIQNYQSIIDRMEKELLSLQEESKKYSGIQNNFDDDNEIQKLRLRLSSYQETNNDKIQKEKEIAASIISNLRSQIDLALKQNESELKMIQSSNDKDHKTFRDSFQEKSNYRKQLKEQFEGKISEMQNKYEEERNQNLQNYDKKVQEMQQAITDIRNEINSFLNGQFQIESDKNSSILNEKIEHLQIDYDTQLQNLLANKIDIMNQSASELSAAEEKRNRLIESVKARPMREEEKIVIDNLSTVLEEETEKLRKVGMEFLDMRESLAIRDKQFNQRFGNVPQVLESKNQKRRGASSAFTRKKPLPPLAQPNVFI